MKTHFITLRLAATAGLIGGVLGMSETWADASADKATVQQNGLRPLGTYYVLAGESKLNAKFRDVRKLQKQLTEANRQLQLVEGKVKQNKDLSVQYVQQRRLLRQRLNQIGSARQRNQIIEAMNELTDRITLLTQGGDYAEPLKQAHANASQAREGYAQHVIELRELYDELAKQYEQLASNTPLQAALENLNRSQAKKRRLGPTRTFLLSGARLKKLEETVFSQSIDLRRGPGNLLYVVAYINGKHAQEIAVDTGASIVTLPEKVAQQAGVKITDQDPSITLRVADGGTFEARQVTIGSVRVGKFTVEDVPCAVLPEKFDQAPPLLGQSFLRHFVYKINADSGKLIMTKVKDDGK